MNTENLNELLNILGLKKEEFAEWLSGQTVGFDKEGNIDIYDHDIIRWIRIKIKGEKTYFD